MRKRNGFISKAAVIAALGFTVICCFTTAAAGEIGASINAELIAAFGYGRYLLAGLLAWLIWIIVNQERKILVWLYAASACVFSCASLCELQHGGYGYILTDVAMNTMRHIGAAGLYLVSVTLCAAPFLYQKRRSLAGRAKELQGFFENTIKPELENFKLFIDVEDDGTDGRHTYVSRSCKPLQSVFDSRNVDATVVDSVDQYSTVKYFVKPGAGGFAAVKNLKDDIELKLKNTVAIGKENERITITLNKPASQKKAPGLSMWLNHIKANKNPLALPVAIDTNGQPQFADLFTESHLLVGGGSGSGKTTWLYSVILGLALVNNPDNLEMLLVDGKESDLAILNPLPHLVMDVLMDNTRAAIALDYIENEIADRKRQKRQGVSKFKPLLFLIDEVDAILPKNPDLMDRVIQISGQARSFNILMVITAKRVVKKFVDKAITDNFLARLCLMVSDMEASQNILGSSYTQGADLTGKGDLFFKAGPLIRGQGYLIDEKHKGEASKLVKKITETYPAINRMPLDDNENEIIEGECTEPDDGIDLFIPNKAKNSRFNAGSEKRFTDSSGRFADSGNQFGWFSGSDGEPADDADVITFPHTEDQSDSFGSGGSRSDSAAFMDDIGGCGTEPDSEPDADIDSKILKLHSASLTEQRIADQLGISKSKVHRALDRYGLTKKSSSNLKKTYA